MKEVSRFPILFQILGFVQLGVVYYYLYNGWVETPRLAASVSIGVFVLLWMFRLKLQIDEKGIHVNIFYFINKLYTWEQIQNIQLGKLHPMKDFAGWGIRLSRKHGVGYITGTKNALYLSLNNGKKRAISVKNDVEAEKVILKYFRKK